MEWIKLSEIREMKRFDASPFVSKNASLVRISKQFKNEKLGKKGFVHKVRNRNSRVYVDNSENGVMYLSNTDMQMVEYDSTPLMSKKFLSSLEEQKLDTGDILVSAVGTIGQVTYVGELLKGAVISGNILRYTANELPGFVYAYLISKYGQANLKNIASGSVQDFITPPKLENLSIPVISDAIKFKTNKNIKEVAKLRSTADKLIKKADELFHQLNCIEYDAHHLCVSENSDGLGFTVSISRKSSVSLKAKNHSKRVQEIKKIWEGKQGLKIKDYITKDFKIGPRGTFKRIDSEVVGISMVSQGDLHRSNPKSYKKVFISRRSEDDFAKKNQVLFPAVGNGSSEGEILFRPTLAYKRFENQLLSGDIGRLECQSTEHAAYLYIALKSKGGFRMMRAFYYGTQLRRPLWELLRDINIPISNKDCFEQVSSLVIKAFDLRNQANILEDNSVKIIEKEMESWQG